MKVLGVSGSLRKASFNTAALKACAELMPAGMTLSIAEIGDLPLFNQDVFDAGLPEPVKRFRAAVAAADGLLIASPEYNYGIPGVLKNAIDWVSRPSRGSPLEGKPVAIMGASAGASGTMRMQLQLRQTLQAVGMYAMPRPEIFVTFCRDKFDADGRLTDEKTREHLRRFLTAFVEWTRRF